MPPLVVIFFTGSQDSFDGGVKPIDGAITVSPSPISIWAHFAAGERERE